MPSQCVGCTYLCFRLPKPPCSKLQFHALAFKRYGIELSSKFKNLELIKKNQIHMMIEEDIL